MKKYEGSITPSIYRLWDLEEFRARPLIYGLGGDRQEERRETYQKIEST